MAEKIIVGMSGGVDSSVAAYLLKNKGYELIGVTLTVNNTEAEKQAVYDAKTVCESLRIEHIVKDYSDVFANTVKKNFVEEYIKGHTPNPCVICNRVMKWKGLLDIADEMNIEYIGTGHYARLVELENGRYSVEAVGDKDQSYVLYSLTQKQLKRTKFVLSDYTKEEIRNIAAKIGLDVANKPDSQEICFIPDNDYASFVEKMSGETLKQGNFVDKDGNILGKHKGIIHYTIGQRKGLGIALGKPGFVVDIKPETNEVVIGDNEDVFSSSLLINKINLMGTERINDGDRVLAKIRYAHKGTFATLRKEDEDLYRLDFEEGVRAVTKGQSCVMYQDGHIYGGGIIC